jgi:hypothetical protein
MNIKTVTAKFGKMRKAVEWVVYPKSSDSTNELLLLQSDHRCIIIDPKERRGILSPNVANYPRFDHCGSGVPGREVITDIPQEFIDAAKAAQPQKGDTIGGGVVIG